MPEPRGPGGPLARPLPIFGRSNNPIPTGEGRLCPPITTGTPNNFQLPASLTSTYIIIFEQKFQHFQTFIVYSENIYTFSFHYQIRQVSM